MTFPQNIMRVEALRDGVLAFAVTLMVVSLGLEEPWLGQEPISGEGLASLFRWYGLGFLLILLCFSLMYHRARKKTKSVSGSLNLLFYSRHFVIYVGVSALSIGLAILGPALLLAFCTF